MTYAQFIFLDLLLMFNFQNKLFYRCSKERGRGMMVLYKEASKRGKKIKVQIDFFYIYTS